MFSTEDPLEQSLVELLTAGVRIATDNPEATPRPGQLGLSLDIHRALNAKAGMSGVAPTGTGKSLAHMSCAALAAVEHKERTVISTDSLALQAQFIEKDLPVVEQACEELFGFTLRYAVLKGVSNYVDPVKLRSLAHELTGQTGEQSFKALQAALTKQKLNTAYKSPARGEYSSPRVLADLCAWGLGEYLRDNLHGDRDSCPVNHTRDDWSLISASSEEKAEEADTGYIHKADTAKEIAGAAHIVVTNHTLLGMQAARKIPVVFGSKKLGRFHNIIVDEGHTLPSQVRARGAAEVSGRSIMQAARTVAKVIEGRWVIEDAEMLSEKVGKALNQYVADLPKWEDAIRIAADDIGPIGEMEEEILSFTGSLWTQVDRILDTTENVELKQRCRVAKAALDRLDDAVADAIEPSSKLARWVSRGEKPFPARFESSPVDVSSMIYYNLWNVAPADTSEMERESLEEGDQIALGVAVVSATLPTNFNMQVALGGVPGEYASPFDEAYAGSAMYIPQCLGDTDIAALKKEGYTQKLTFDTYRHEDWAVNHIVELVRANSGSSLILSAKASSGKKYVEELRRKLPHMTIHSQWDGSQVSRIVQEWRDDAGSVLVGTKSLMTGVDAPGETNTLVIIDRPPRAAKNVIDEARLEQIMERVGDRWTADRLVYVADAALLLDQSVGRLIRSTEDRGMVALLDPRLLTNQWSAFSYATQTRQEFVKPLLKFGHKFNDLGMAKAWLEGRKAHAIQQAELVGV